MLSLISDTKRKYTDLEIKLFYFVFYSSYTTDYNFLNSLIDDTSFPFNNVYSYISHGCSWYRLCYSSFSYTSLYVLFFPLTINKPNKNKQTTETHLPASHVPKSPENTKSTKTYFTLKQTRKETSSLTLCSCEVCITDLSWDCMQL